MKRLESDTVLSASKIFASLPGLWSIDRTVPGVGAMGGSAFFTPDESGQIYHNESGTFKYPQGEGDFFQEYIYTLENESLVIYFAKNSKKQGHFLTLALNKSNQAFCQHLCKQDLYNAFFSFEKNTFKTHFTVKGPRKNHVIKTIYKKIRDL